MNLTKASDPLDLEKLLEDGARLKLEPASFVRAIHYVPDRGCTRMSGAPIACPDARTGRSVHLLHHESPRSRTEAHELRAF